MRSSKLPPVRPSSPEVTDERSTKPRWRSVTVAIPSATRSSSSLGAASVSEAERSMRRSRDPGSNPPPSGGGGSGGRIAPPELPAESCEERGELWRGEDGSPAGAFSWVTSADPPPARWTSSSPWRENATATASSTDATAPAAGRAPRGTLGSVGRASRLRAPSRRERARPRGECGSGGKPARTRSPSPAAKAGSGSAVSARSSSASS